MEEVAAQGRPSVLNLKFATLLGSRSRRTSNSKSTLESTFSSVADDSEIRSKPSITIGRISESPHWENESMSVEKMLPEQFGPLHSGAAAILDQQAMGCDRAHE
jgi:hypothetical protein